MNRLKLWWMGLFGKHYKLNNIASGKLQFVGKTCNRYIQLRGIIKIKGEEDVEHPILATLWIEIKDGDTVEFKDLQVRII